MRGFGFLAFVALTFCCWGVYGPVLHIGQEQMGDGPGKLSSLRPFVCVGVAYFLIAVVYPVIMLRAKGEDGAWSFSGIVWSFIAGAIGAIGSLGIILAFKFQGKPVYVMPLVFGLAPIVNTIVTMLMSGTWRKASWLFFVGIVVVAVGAAGVLTFKPKKAKVIKPETSVTETTQEVTVSMQTLSTQTLSMQTRSASECILVRQEPDDSTQETLSKTDSSTNAQESKTAKETTEKKSGPNLAIIFACIGMTALCWGSYGPVLHKGQASMGGSRLRPFLCVGLAYFAVAVVVPLVLQGMLPPEPGGWNRFSGAGWSLLAGAAGAIGALGIIYAFNFGGKPVFVMPLVFGFAPVINTLTETFSKNLFSQVSTPFLGSLAMVIVGAVIVLVFAPRGKKPPAPSPAE